MTAKPVAPREYNRYDPVHWGSKVSINTGEKKFAAEVVDESITGLGVVVSETTPLTNGQIVLVDNGTFSRVGRIAFVGEPKEGSRRVGMNWAPQSEYQKA